MPAMAALGIVYPGSEYSRRKDGRGAQPLMQGRNYSNVPLIRNNYFGFRLLFQNNSLLFLLYFHEKPRSVFFKNLFLICGTLLYPTPGTDSIC